MRDCPASAAPALSSDEEQLVTDYRSLNAEGREKVSEYAADLVASGRYKKEPIVSAGLYAGGNNNPDWR